MKAPVNTKTRKPENAKTGGINLWTRKRRKRENGENAKTARTRKPRKRGKRENAKTAKTRKRRKRRKPENGQKCFCFLVLISRFLVFSVFWFSRFLVFSFRWPHPSGQVAFFMCLAPSCLPTNKWQLAAILFRSFRAEPVIVFSECVQPGKGTYLNSKTPHLTKT